ncbi:MAG: M23 family metallopeptidase [Candidatus Aminicenantales bacterium]
MPRKILSLIIVPHKKGKPKTISLSKRAIQILIGIFAFLFIVLVVFLADYFTMNVTRKKYKALVQDNIKKDETIARYQNTVAELKATIDHFENYAKKLNIMAGLKSPDILKEVGIGGGTSNSYTGGTTGISRPISLNRLETVSQKAQGVEKNLTTLVNFFENQSLKLAGTPTIAPTKGYWVSSYGWRDDPFTGKRAFHRGIDIATYFGNPVMATADGVVIQTTYDKIGGKTIKISHRGGYTTVYCHLSKFLVKPGQKVKRGETIGLVGKTGKALGPHVHYEVRLNGKSVNPYYYILEE